MSSKDFNLRFAQHTLKEVSKNACHRLGQAWKFRQSMESALVLKSAEFEVRDTSS